MEQGGIRIQDALKQSMWAIRENRLRTLLSVLGILVGIIAVMVVGTVTNTVRHYIFNELESYGLKTVWIYRDWEQKIPNATQRSGSGITNSDLEKINKHCCPALRKISPEVYFEDWNVLARSGSRYDNVVMEGVGVNFFDISNERVTLGRLFRPEDINRRRSVAVIGPEVQKQLFGMHQNPIGKSIRINELKLTVIGLLKEKKRDFLSSIGAAENFDINNRVFIPYTLHQTLTSSKNVHRILGEANDLASVQPAINQVIGTLARRHNKKYAYTWESMEAWIDTADSILTNITLIGILSASISLFVGGIGIMNIMTTSVIERTKEIGIRKALGARNKDIHNQFLLEAIFVSSIGGILGLIIGFAISYAIVLSTGLPALPSWIVILAALLVTMLVGVISGYYPASRAARLKPVDALRHQ